MSRRYGRNQRRAHRLALAEQQQRIELIAGDVNRWQQANQRNEGLLSYQRESHNLLESQMNTAVQYLGQHHAALPPGPYRVHLRAGEPIRIFAPELSSNRAYSERADMMRTLQVHDLHQLAVQAEVSPTDGRLHVRASFMGGYSTYAATRPAIMDMPKQVLIEHLSREIAHHLAEQIKGN